MKRPLGAFLTRGLAPQGQQQPQHVAQVAAGVGEQGQRIADDAVDRFGRDEAGIQHDADQKRLAEVLGRVRVVMTGVRVALFGALCSRLAVRVTVVVVVVVIGHVVFLGSHRAAVTEVLVVQAGSPSTLR